ncbi:uncharacterized protein LOC118506181 [Anopheles stephensi]|uniref:uncharacterized protein LOC118506181 n=1 Tax=Anopheles stephensi TaxID=30069 RepID=UPI001658B729|nr:uncharacterized protein LOC118506181 [Anopheles stephensi]
MPVTRASTKDMDTVELSGAETAVMQQPEVSMQVQVLRIKLKVVHKRLINMQTDPTLAQVQSKMLEELKAEQHTLLNQLIEQLPYDLDKDIAEDEVFQAEYLVKAASLQSMDVKPPPVAAQLVMPQHRLHIPMPTFDGSYEQWPKFKAMFQDIMSRANESDAVKLHHLNKALTGKAAGIINASMMNSNNFESVWEILVQRFENPRLIVDKHIAGLLHLKALPRESAKDLRHLAETCKAHVDGLIFMEKPIDGTSNLIITHILSSCLDAETRKLWERSLKHGEFPELYKTLEFITRQTEVLESCATKEPQQRQPSGKPASTKAFVSSTPNPPQLCCALCKQQHPLHKCPTFLILTTTDKIEKLKTLNRCFNCFGTGHAVSKCPSPWSCRHCKGRHHTLIHVENSRVTPGPSPVTGRQSTTATTTLTTVVSSTVLLSTAMLNITDSAGVTHPARVLLDSGAQSSFITGRLAQFLCLPRKLVNIPLSGIGGSAGSNVRHTVTTTIHSRCSSYNATVEMLVLPKLTVEMPRQYINISHWSIPEACVLADPSFNNPAPIDLILGASLFYEILRTGRLSLGDNMPTLQETEFGWVVSGNTIIEEPLSSSMCAVVTHTNELDSLMKRFFELEEVSGTPSWSNEERACEEHYTATTTTDINGRYVVRLPRKAEMIGKLGDSKTSALRRFLAIERRLQREPETQQAYVDFMNEYLRLGHMSKVAATSMDAETFYLPHHPVFKADSTTTKCRVVFDASSKSSTGVSLNDTLMVGPTIQQDATSILLRFRTRAVALTADVAKMYRQVLVHPTDRSLQRILWRNSPNEPIEEYELNTVTYGTASAPFLAVRSLQQTVEDHGKEYPAAAARSCDFYVDDFVSGSDSPAEAESLQVQTAELYAKTGFELRKWASNKPSVLQHVDQQQLAATPSAESGAEGVLATLGLVWDSSSDNMSFKINAPYVIGPITKRKVLSCIARIYDPLGIVDPVKAMAKQFLQRIWTLQTDQQHPWGWDDELPHHLQGQWINFHNQLIHLQELHIPRVAIGPDSISSQFHFFCDASEKGYGACCYIRSCNEQGVVTIQLFASKTKVTPISSKHSIARLELCAAQLASLLYNRVKSAVELQSPATFWTDSTTVVHWLRGSPSCWKPFVANRVSQVQQLTTGCAWRHIAGIDNPANLASRGCLSKELLNNPLWWQGPPWLNQPEEQWPESSISSFDDDAAAERRASTVACAVVEKPHHRVFTLYSSFSKLRRMMAYWVQYFNRCSKRRSYTGPGITTADLKEAEEVMCRLAQRDYFTQEIRALQRKESISSSSKLKWLHPQLGADGIIRVGGRLSNALLSEDTKHPIVVPNGHPLAHLLMDHFHKTLLHAGPQLMLNAETAGVPENRLTQWRHVQQLMRHFWNRWHKEYLQQLQPRSKWYKDDERAIVPGRSLHEALFNKN